MKKITITIPESVPGLNGADGLMREHFRAKKKRQERYQWIIRSQTSERFLGKVIVVYTRYSVTQQDWDNLCASFKHIGDALVACKVIKDDKPSIITQFIPRYGKAKNNSEARSEIEIIENN